MDSELDSDDERRDRAIWYPTKSQQIAEAERELLAAVDESLRDCHWKWAGQWVRTRLGERLEQAIRRYRAAKGLA